MSISNSITKLLNMEDKNLNFNEDFLEEVHELLANSLYLLVPLHVIAALVMSYWQRQNLIKAMITGNKTIADKPSKSE